MGNIWLTHDCHLSPALAFSKSVGGYAPSRVAVQTTHKQCSGKKAMRSQLFIKLLVNYSTVSHVPFLKVQRLILVQLLLPTLKGEKQTLGKE
jgi:hypothetical protein